MVDDTPVTLPLQLNRKGRLLKCPGCLQQGDLSCRQLRSKVGWATVKCKWCCSSSTSKNWECLCGVPWYLCPKHGFDKQPQTRLASGKKKNSNALKKLKKHRYVQGAPELPGDVELCVPKG